MANNETVTTALQVLEKQLNRPLVAALEVCARCGICAEACHYYVADPSLEHVPAYRAEELRKVYRREHDFFGKHFPNWVNAQRLGRSDARKNDRDGVHRMYALPPLHVQLPDGGGHAADDARDSCDGDRVRQSARNFGDARGRGNRKRQRPDHLPRPVRSASRRNGKRFAKDGRRSERADHRRTRRARGCCTSRSRARTRFCRLPRFSGRRRKTGRFRFTKPRTMASFSAIPRARRSSRSASLTRRKRLA